jgi:hypothetical protein
MDLSSTSWELSVFRLAPQLLQDAGFADPIGLAGLSVLLNKPLNHLWSTIPISLAF